MTKLDLTKQYKSYFTAKTKPGLVEIEAAQFISISAAVGVLHQQPALNAA